MKNNHRMNTINPMARLVSNTASSFPNLAKRYMDIPIAKTAHGRVKSTKRKPEEIVNGIPHRSFTMTKATAVSDIGNDKTNTQKSKLDSSVLAFPVSEKSAGVYGPTGTGVQLPPGVPTTTPRIPMATITFPLCSIIGDG